MGLSEQMRDELAAYTEPKGALRAAELATILRFAGGLHRISGRLVVEVDCESQAVADLVTRDLTELFGAEVEVLDGAGALGVHGGRVVRVAKRGEQLARQTGLIDSRNHIVRGLPSSLVSAAREVTVAVWRGAVIARGALTDPGRTATLEVTCPGNEAAMALVGTARRLDVPAKAREVRSVHRVVVRDTAAIVSLLRTMGATTIADVWDEARRRRVNRAAANRLVNFDDANLRRSAQAAVAAGARVQRALDILGDDVPDHLRYAGALRLMHKQASLDELGHLADPPMTKDAVAGRIRRLLAMADKRAEELGIANTEVVLSEDLDTLD